jgi:hypothetical protein
MCASVIARIACGSYFRLSIVFCVSTRGKCFFMKELK